MGELVYHRVLVRVPVSFVQKAGSYHFVISSMGQSRPPSQRPSS
jgi:hypothetical protein